MEISSTFWLPDITDWWHQQDEIHPKYADLSNVAHNIFSIIPHGVIVEASYSLGRDSIGWRESEMTGESVLKKVVVRQFAGANNGILVGDWAALDTADTANYLELKKEAEARKLHTTAKVHKFLKMWQCSQNLRATQKKSLSPIKQITAVRYISDTKETIKASWSNFQHDGAAAFKLSEWSPIPPAVSTKDLPGGRTQVSNVRRIRTIDCHPIKRDEESAPESIANTENWLNWNGDLGNSNECEDDCEADNQSDIELGSGIKASESPEHRVVNAIPDVPELIQLTRRLMNQAEDGLMTVSAMETRRNKGNKKK